MAAELNNWPDSRVDALGIPPEAMSDGERVRWDIRDRFEKFLQAKASVRVDVALHWAGVAVRPHVLVRTAVRYDRRSDYLQELFLSTALIVELACLKSVAKRLHATHRSS